MQVGNGSFLELAGRAEVNVRVGDRDYPHEFFISKCESACSIIGLDFLKRYEAALDVTRHTLFLGSTFSPLYDRYGCRVSKQACTSAARVLCAAVTSLPPGKEARVEVFTSGGAHIENAPVMFEKSVKLAAHKGLVAQNALYPDAHHVKDVMVLNTTNQYVVLNPNDTLGVLNEACGAVMFPNMNQHSLDTPTEATPTDGACHNSQII